VTSGTRIKVSLALGGDFSCYSKPAILDPTYGRPPGLVETIRANSTGQDDEPFALGIRTDEHALKGLYGHRRPHSHLILAGW